MLFLSETGGMRWNATHTTDGWSNLGWGSDFVLSVDLGYALVVGTFKWKGKDIEDRNIIGRK